MEVGELVYFYSTVFSPPGEPGIIVEKVNLKKFVVLWSSGKITTEFVGYLMKVK